MEFGSKYVYTYSDSEEEEVSEDEYEGEYTAWFVTSAHICINLQGLKKMCIQYCRQCYTYAI